MNSATTPTLVALVVQLALALVIFQSNSKRKSNQSFLLLSLVAGAWLGSSYYALTATNAHVAEFWIRQASAAGALVFTAFNLLRISVRWNQESWRAILYRSRFWLVASVGIVCLCETKWFLTGAMMPSQTGLVAPTADRRR